ncbi:LysR family transcriptional regulator [Shewanella waksmanii]|uniref:LysR family transcriptional regulator n=1 Tax=Shewanella waksmanii TaxID=213783 RepID=UPI00048B3D3F|nr:LysR family transcriptional regulator [Shewanella waksmanii]
MDAGQLYRMLVFASVVKHGSLTAAADSLAISRSMVSQHLKRLEQRCGTSLLHRTTRKISLTTEGQAFYFYCAELLHLANQADSALIPADDQLRGSIKLTAPVAFGERCLIPILTDFHRQYPHLHLNLQLDDNQRDLIEHKIDLAISAQPLTDTRLTSVKIAQYDEYIVASPKYTAEQGTPLHPDSLGEHRWVLHSGNQLPIKLQLDNSDKERFGVAITPFACCNTLNGTMELVISGVGIGMLEEHLVSDSLASGELVRLLPDYHLGNKGFFASHPYQDQLPPRVAALLNLLQQQFANPQE